MSHIIAMKTSDGLYIPYDGGIIAFETQKKAIAEMENIYNVKHHGGYESSMSACVHFLQTQPTVVTLPNDPQELKPILELDETDDSIKLFTVRSVSARFQGLKVKESEAEKFLADGVSPRLISEDTFK